MKTVLFPPASSASPEGIVAVGAAPEPEILKAAYRQGIFPWPHRGLPLLWFSPDPRFVLEPAQGHLHRSLRKELRRTALVIRADTAFRAVIQACARTQRPAQRGTWITRDMIEGYCALHEEGLAHSVEAWRGDKLVGGLYGVSLGGTFFGESMFQTEPDASKVAFAVLLATLVRWGFDLVDCQSYTDHLARFGATHWPRARFLAQLEASVQKPDRAGPWRELAAPAEAADALVAPLPRASDGDA